MQVKVASDGLSEKRINFVSKMELDFIRKVTSARKRIRSVEENNKKSRSKISGRIGWLESGIGKNAKKKVSSEFVGSCKDKKSSETFVGSCKNNKKVPTKKILTEFVGIFCERKKTRSLSLSLSLSLLSLSLFKMDGKVPSSIKRPTQNVPTKNLGGALADGKDRAIQIGRSESCCQGQGHPTRDHPLAKPHQSPQVDTCSFGRANMRSFQRKQRQMTFWRFSPTVLCRINGALICSD